MLFRKQQMKNATAMILLLISLTSIQNTNALTIVKNTNAACTNNDCKGTEGVQHLKKRFVGALVGAAGSIATEMLGSGMSQSRSAEPAPPPVVVAPPAAPTKVNNHNVNDIKINVPPAPPTAPPPTAALPVQSHLGAQMPQSYAQYQGQQYQGAYQSNNGDMQWNQDPYAEQYAGMSRRGFQQGGQQQQFAQEGLQPYAQQQMQQQADYFNNAYAQQHQQHQQQYPPQVGHYPYASAGY
ncbi:hypothetical protein MIR68_011762 [Amoeboaphelidium protococcarum]|nr:hypothetical protein MIR68_011762 [Amoeboaphelidium protococcarum]